MKRAYGKWSRFLSWMPPISRGSSIDDSDISLAPNIATKDELCQQHLVQTPSVHRPETMNDWTTNDATTEVHIATIGTLNTGSKVMNAWSRWHSNTCVSIFREFLKHGIYQSALENHGGKKGYTLSPSIPQEPAYMAPSLPTPSTPGQKLSPTSHLHYPFV